MRLALTGITSGVGRRLCEVALEQGHEVAGLVREPGRADARALDAAGVRLVPGDVADEAALGELTDSAEAVVHMAAAVGDWGDRAEFERVNVGGTRAVLEAAARARVRRFVQLSSVAVYGRPERGRVTEQSPLRKTGEPYDDTKLDAEVLAFRRGRELGLEVAAVRPPIIYGPYDRNFMPRTVALLRKKSAVLVDGGRAPLNLVWVDHVVDVLLRSAERPEAAGEAFNVMDTVSARPPTVRAVLEAIADACGLERPRLSLPRPLAMAAAFAVDRGWKLARADKPPPFTPFVVRLMTCDVVYDAAKAVAELGWQPRLSPLEGVRRFAREHLDAGRSAGRG
ncbi:MAG: NAD-dependent epimerase/dehydratase family protein [Polyangiaceae bacterium]|nr:NAD-dependent epimerase/dehydratase family protein [Polyangiaceae bacterium]